MNSISIIQTYYNDKDFLQKQIEHWKKIQVPVAIILIDDGSSEYPAFDIVKDVEFNSNIKFSLYAVTENIGFNSHGCRNLGAAVSRNDWLIFLDIDHFLEIDDLSKIYSMDLNQNNWYSFTTAHKNDTFPSMNTFMCSKKMFELGGGYDESYVPFHYGDKQFLNMMENKFTRKELLDIVIRCVRAGRTTHIDVNLEKPVYDNEKLIMYSPKFDPTKIIYHNKRLNFCWKKLI